MNYKISIIIHFVCVQSLVNCNCDILQRDVERFKTNATYIPIEIIANYLHKYFDDEEIFFSISLSSLNDETKYFQEDLIDKLVINPKFSNFSYNILHEIDQSRIGHQKVFNLIFIDGSTSLS